jgi:hypothetical protein
MDTDTGSDVESGRESPPLALGTENPTSSATATTLSGKTQPWKAYMAEPDMPDAAIPELEGEEDRVVRIEREKDAPDALGG